MGSIKNLVSDTIWYGLSSIIGRLISYLLMPLYTYVFLPNEYGIITELYAYVAFFYVIYTYGMETSYFRFATKNKSEEQKYFNLTVSCLITTSIIFSGSFFFFGQAIASSLGYPGKEIIIYWLAIIMGVDSVVAIPFARLRLKAKAKKFALIRLFHVSFSVVMNLFFYVFCFQIIEGDWFPGLKESIEVIFDTSFKVKYVFLSNLVANSLFLALLYKEFKGYRFQLDWEFIKPVMRYALPLLFMGLAAVTNEMLSRALLKEWLPQNFYEGQSSLDALGVFGACYKLSVFMMLGIQAFRYAAEPFFFNKSKDNQSPELFASVMNGFVIFNSFILIIVSVNLDLIGILFLSNPIYREGLYIVPFLLLGYLFNGVYYNISVWYKVTDKTHWGAIITIIGAVITVILNYVLIPILGYFGSSLVTLISFFIMAFINYMVGQRNYPIPYDLKRGLFYIVSASLIVYIFYPMELDNLWLTFLFKNISLLLFLAIVYILERKNLKGKQIFGFTLP